MAIKPRALLIAAAVGAVVQTIFQLINSGTLLFQFMGGLDVTQMTGLTQAVGSLLCVCGLIVDIAGGFLYAYLGGRESPVSAGHGALGGALAGLVARFISTAVGSCISVVLIPMFQAQAVADLPPEAAEAAAGLGIAGGIVGIFISLCIFLVLGGLFGAIGGAIGGATVGKGRATSLVTTRLYLIRHAATTFAAENRFAGSSNVPLSEEGRGQAVRLAERLTKHPPAAVYCSPLGRTIETASLIGKPHGLTPITKDGIREIDHGHWEGLTRAEVESRYPREIEGWDTDPFGYAPEGGETGMSVMVRAIPAIQSIVTAHPDQTVYVVSHKATNRIIIGYYMGIELKGFRDRIDQQPACLNILDFKDPSRARLMLLNDVSHYEGEPDMLHVHLSPWWASEIQNPS